MDRIGRAGSTRHQVMARPVDELTDCPVSRRDAAHQDALMVVSAPPEHRRNERDAETAAPGFGIDSAGSILCCFLFAGRSGLARTVVAGFSANAEGSADGSHFAINFAKP